MATKIWAHIQNNIVIEIIPLDSTLVPGKDVFHTSITLIDVTLEPGVAVGWIYDGNIFVAPSTAPTVEQLQSYAKATFDAVLVKGMTFPIGNGVTILCDGTPQTRSDLALLALFGQANPTGTKTWYDNNGVATVLTGTQLVTLATLAGNWVSDCYPAYAALITSIIAIKPTITTFAQIDAATWPLV